MSEDSQPGQRKDRLVLRAQKIRFQKDKIVNWPQLYKLLNLNGNNKKALLFLCKLCNCYYYAGFLEWRVEQEI